MNKSIDFNSAILYIMDKAEENNFYIAVADSYCEPGYDNPAGCIVSANWNKDNKKVIEGSKIDVGNKVHIRANPFDDEERAQMYTIGEALEKLGCDAIWEDEWTMCDNCMGFVRTQADSYSWQSSYDGDSCLCHTCLKKDEEALEDYIERYVAKPTKAMTLDIDLEEHGFTRIDQEFENGWYGGQDADPKAIAKELESKGIGRYVFVLDSVGQFDMSFSVWANSDQLREANIDHVKEYHADEDPADVLSRGLKAASNIKASNNEGGIQVIKVIGDRAISKTISPQDFIDGKAID